MALGGIIYHELVQFVLEPVSPFNVHNTLCHMFHQTPTCCIRIQFFLLALNLATCTLICLLSRFSGWSMGQRRALYFPTMGKSVSYHDPALKGILPGGLFPLYISWSS